MSAAAPTFSKKDVPCASVNNVIKISQSEYANLRPIQKALNKLKLTCTDLMAAEQEYYQLFKRDENFKRRFPEQVFTLFQAILDIFSFMLFTDAKLTISIHF